MEQLLVFDARVPMDGLLARLSGRFSSRGYTVEAAETFDLEIKGTGTRAFVGIGAHPEGLAARIKCKALIPGNARELLVEVRGELIEALGEPLDRTSELEEGR